MKVSLHLHEYDDKALSKKLEKEVEEAVRRAKERGFNPYTEVREFVAPGHKRTNCKDAVLTGGTDLQHER